MIAFDVQGGLARVTLSRPGARNAIDPEMVLDLERAWQVVRDDPEIRVALLTGEGDTFCAGADLTSLIPTLTSSPETRVSQAGTARDSLARGPLFIVKDQLKPVVAAVNGDALGAGLELVLAADLRVASTTARFGFPEVRWGLAPTGLCISRLLRQISSAAAMRMLLTGETIDAARALDIGLVNEVVEPGSCVPRSVELAERIAANGPLAVQAVRRAARECAGLGEEEAWEASKVMARAVFATKDAREGPAAFAEKRKPRFLGH